MVAVASMTDFAHEMDDDDVSPMNSVSLARKQELEPLLRGIFDDVKTKLGLEHPQTLVAMGNLAALLHELGKFEEAEKLYRQTIEMREEVLGATHSDTLFSTCGLAGMLQGCGRTEEAEVLFRRAAERYTSNDELAQGPEHQACVASLAALLEESGQLAEAEEFRNQVE
eukprot:TRINITY_DN32657_c0_g1_i1.p1 TRINITY_DN32657_c0_g1~~TRINITY_DN32657_c0_g1_i1.p1  ORF type:complete len:169 (+),score=39.82 TRINITY_DN32657_c0_g1_i1:37-543(+)